MAIQQRSEVMERYFEQRDFHRATGKWSRWYRSSLSAYREHCAGPVRCFEVRESSKGE
jgi:hypothetical protein